MNSTNPAAAAAREAARTSTGQFGHQHHSKPEPFILEGCTREEEQRLEAQRAHAAGLAEKHARAMLKATAQQRPAIADALRGYRHEVEVIDQQLAWYRRRDPRTIAVPDKPAWSN